MISTALFTFSAITFGRFPIRSLSVWAVECHYFSLAFYSTLYLFVLLYRSFRLFILPAFLERFCLHILNFYSSGLCSGLRLIFCCTVSYLILRFFLLLLPMFGASSRCVFCDVSTLTDSVGTVSSFLGISVSVHYNRLPFPLLQCVQLLALHYY